MKTVIIDYGSGNLRSAEKSIIRAATAIGIEMDVVVSSSIDDVLTADKIILPGVGAYGDCMAGLKGLDGMIEALDEVVIKNAKPFLGICVGMQLMSTAGLEHGKTEGLNWIGGTVEKMTIKNDENSDRVLKIPHMGWNDLYLDHEDHPLLKDINDGDHVYFVHSYHFKADQPSHILAHVNYGEAITAMIGRDNIIGTQFHPEKSQKVGLQFLANFLQWSPE